MQEECSKSLLPMEKEYEAKKSSNVFTGWGDPPFDVAQQIFEKFGFQDLLKCKAVCRPWMKRIENLLFCQSPGVTPFGLEGSWTAINFFIKNNEWRCAGFDIVSNSWRSLPPFSYLPPPDADLFKEYSVSGDRSLMCASIAGTSPKEGEILVFNPLTGRKRALPPVLYPRYPAVVHILVDPDKNSYIVVVAGSSSASDKHLSEKVEVFHSTTSKWIEGVEVSGPMFGLNEHQTAVCINGVLYCIAFLNGNRDRAVVALDVENGTWLKNLTCPIPFLLYSNTLQLVECDGKLHVFSEQERGASVEHCIDVLESAREGAWNWRNVVRVKRSGGRGPQVYPEHTCVSFGEEKLCILNTLSRDGAVYDMRDGKQVAALLPHPANQKGERFFTLNPASFTLQPRCDTNPASFTLQPRLDVQDSILKRVDFKDLFRFKALSKACEERIESGAFRQPRGAPSEGSFTAISYYIRNSAWQCSGYDMESNLWRSLPTLSCLPTPDAGLFKEFSVSGHGSLMCAHVSKLPKKGELVVFNPLTGRKRALPPLLNPRTPVVVHISVDSGGKSYIVVVAGSSSACDEHLSKKVEVFRSTSGSWTEASDIPGSVFGLNEHQAGVCINGVLYFIAFLKGSCHRGVVAFDVENGTWLDNLTCPIPFSLLSNTLQLVECDGKLLVFSEQDRGASVEHCIDVLELAREGTGHWRNVVRVKSSGGRGLQVYPEHTCVSFGEEKLCVLNTLSRDGAVYDMRNGKQVAALLPPPANQNGEHFFILNPASFTLQPSFHIDPELMNC